MLLRQPTNSATLGIRFGVVLTALSILLWPFGVWAVSSIAQAFKTGDTGIVSGAIVSLKVAESNTVELSSSDNTDRMIGVAGEDSLVELSNGSGSIKVVTSGQTPVLVSDINGTLKVGDKVTASPIAGVGMRAVKSGLIIGTAQANLADVQLKTYTLTDKDGKKQSVHIGNIPAQVDKVFYEAPQDRNSFVPAALQEFADNLAGRKVSPIRIIVAAFLIMFVLITIVVLVYATIRSSIISIGRNPLSENSVRKAMFQVGITVLGVLAFTVIFVYLILTT